MGRGDGGLMIRLEGAVRFIGGGGGGEIVELMERSEARFIVAVV